MKVNLKLSEKIISNHQIKLQLSNSHKIQQAETIL